MPRVRVGDLELFYDTEGTGDPLLLLMGLGGAHRAWHFQRPALAERHRLVLVDNRDAGESDIAALAREWIEELGCRVAESSARPLGIFECAAANEPGQRVRAAVYAVDVEGTVIPRAEIDQVLWVDPSALPALPLAPLTRDYVLSLASTGSA